MSYTITPDGPLGFQASATHPDHELRVIGHFSTLAEAEAFADSLRQIDGGRSYSMGPSRPAGRLIVIGLRAATPPAFTPPL